MVLGGLAENDVNIRLVVDNTQANRALKQTERNLEDLEKTAKKNSLTFEERTARFKANTAAIAANAEATRKLNESQERADETLKKWGDTAKNVGDLLGATLKITLIATAAAFVALSNAAKFLAEGPALSKAEAAIEKLKDAGKRLIATTIVGITRNEQFMRVMDSLAVAVSNVDWETFGRALAGVLTIVGKVVQGILALVNGIIRLGKELGLLARFAVDSVKFGFEKALELWDLNREAVINYRVTLEDLGEGLSLTSEQQKKLNASLAISEKIIKKFTTELKKTVTESERYKEIVKQLERGTIDQATATEKVSDLFQELRAKVFDLVDVEASLEEALARASEGMEGQTERAAALLVISAQLRKEIEELQSTAGKGISLPVPELGASSAGLGDIFSAGNVSSVFSDLFGGAGDPRASAAGLGEILGGDIISTLGPALESGFANILGGLFDGANSGDFKRIVANLGGDIGSAVGGPIGQVLGSELFEGIFDFFDNEDPGKKAREGFTNFIRETLDIPFQQFEDTFSPGTFGLFLDELPGQIRQAFEAVGTFFEDRENSIFGEQIAAIFAGNFEGSLFDLKLALDGLGISVEDLREKILATALDGSQSFLEVASQLQGIGELAGEGVPDQIGAVDVALQKVFNAANNREAIQALEAFGDEAEEAGLSLDQALAVAAETGQFTVEQIEALQHAFELVGATAGSVAAGNLEELVVILADVESQGIKISTTFEETTAQIAELAENLNNLPAEINTRVNVEFVATGDSVAQEVVEDAGGLGLR